MSFFYRVYWVVYTTHNFMTVKCSISWKKCIAQRLGTPDVTNNALLNAAIERTMWGTPTTGLPEQEAKGGPSHGH